MTKVKSLRGGGKLPINRYKYLSAEVDAPEQRGLNENNNGLLWRDGLGADMDFRYLRDDFVVAIANKKIVFQEEFKLPNTYLGIREVSHKGCVHNFLTYFDISRKIKL